MVEAKFVPFDQNKDVIMEIRKSAFGDINDLDAVDNAINTQHVIIYVGCPESLPVATGRLYQDKNETVVDKIAVRKEEQRKKYGELAVRMLIDKTFRNGTDEVFVNSNEENVVFLGYRTDMEKLIQLSDFVASASYREGLPVNIIEGMLCAKPAVVSHNRGHNELVSDGESGLFVDFGNVEKTADAFIKLCSDQTLREKMGNAAYERSEKYSVKSVENELRAIYNDLL